MRAGTVTFERECQDSEADHRITFLMVAFVACGEADGDSAEAALEEM